MICMLNHLLGQTISTIIQRNFLLAVLQMVLSAVFHHYMLVTKVSGLLQQLEGKSNISVMADSGFAIRDQLRRINVDLNIPLFMDGRGQLPASEVLEGCRIASVCIHVLSSRVPFLLL